MCLSWFFKKRKDIFNTSMERPASVQVKKCVEQSGAMLDVNLIKKENACMVEKLKAYLAKYEAEKERIATSEISVEDQVNEYRQQLIAEAEAKRNAEFLKLDNIIAGINDMIAAEEEATKEVTTEVTAE